MSHITLWWIALALALVVTGVVAVLLWQVIATARDIRDGAAVIWARGQQVANNTIHIALLYRTLEAVHAIRDRATGILGHAGAIRDHAETCPGCPECILAGGKDAS
ncbi:hypothetical protein GE300_16800 [Rhodobacteraceae bacterium 2CG4]|uniref:Uncharacterized protein n=1 Tax=Halovulum marinum TaxID=2662447 RepID=A0A6L5Z3V0_9RHOB|nr:hypothetical protein [Halovulum marinum]MSU91243.1 hypothetical protein [Halovulum marinum]